MGKGGVKRLVWRQSLRWLLAAMCGLASGRSRCKRAGLAPRELRRRKLTAAVRCDMYGTLVQGLGELLKSKIWGASTQEAGRCVGWLLGEEEASQVSGGREVRW